MLIAIECKRWKGKTKYCTIVTLDVKNTFNSMEENTWGTVKANGTFVHKKDDVQLFKRQNLIIRYQELHRDLDVSPKGQYLALRLGTSFMMGY